MSTYLAGARVLRHAGKSHIGFLDGLNVEIVPMHDDTRHTLQQVAVGFLTPNEVIENEKALDRDMDAFNGDMFSYSADAALPAAWKALYADWRAYFGAHGTKMSVVFDMGGVFNATANYRNQLNALQEKYRAATGKAPTLGPSVTPSTVDDAAAAKKAAEEAAKTGPSWRTVLMLFGLAGVGIVGLIAYGTYKNAQKQRARLNAAAPHLAPALTHGMVSQEAARHLLGE